MQYRTNKINGDELSILGFGCMRFPKDEQETEKMILYAIEKFYFKPTVTIAKWFMKL